MIKNNTSKLQAIYNNIVSKKDFTISINPNSKGRYIVGTKNVFTGLNPSASKEFNIVTLRDALKQNFCSLGGWLDIETSIYYIDLNTHFDSLKIAILFAIKNDEIAIYDSEKNVVIYI
jgi:hypothetical protein